MNRIFFISGMMRSGTAWASALISLCPNAFCYHEGEAIYREGLVDALRARPEKFAGDSSPGWRKRTDMDRELVASRVAILRDMDDVVPAVRRAFHGLVPTDWVHQDLERLTKWIALHDPLVIPFKTLFTVAGAHRLWNYLLPDEAFPKDKVECLIRTKVEQLLPDKQAMIHLNEQNQI